MEKKQENFFNELSDLLKKYNACIEVDDNEEDWADIWIGFRETKDILLVDGNIQTRSERIKNKLLNIDFNYIKSFIESEKD